MQPQRPAEEQSLDLCRFLAPHLDSFNWAVTRGLEIIPKWIMEQEVQHEADGPLLRLRVVDLSISKPHDSRGNAIYPYQCRLAGSTYGSLLQIKVEMQIDGRPAQTFSVMSDNIPVMVNSILCHLNGMTPSEKQGIMEEATESGGFFVASGYDKILRLLTLNRQNYVFAISRPSFASRGANFSTFATSLRSMAPDCSSVTTQLHYLTTGNIVVLLPVQRRMFFVPMPVILRALLEVEDSTIFNDITEGKDDAFVTDRVIAMIRYSSELGLHTSAAAREYLGAHFRSVLTPPKHFSNQRCAELLIDRYLFPHLTGLPLTHKYNLLIFMAKRLLSLVKKDTTPDNMDASSFHELLTPGSLWLSVLSDSISDFLKATAAEIQRDETHTLDNFDNVISTLRKNASAIEKRMRYLFSTGSIRGSSTLGLSQTEGLTIIAERINYARYLSHYRSVHRGAFFTTMRTTAVRKLLPESWGFLCPVHTPDGGLCGLLCHLARNCEVVTGDPQGGPQIRSLLLKSGMIPSLRAGVPVIIDGCIVGSIPEVLSENAVEKLHVARRSGEIPHTVEIANLPSDGFTRSIYVFTTQQRMMRPVRNVSDDGIEFIGPLEQIFMSIGAHPDDRSRPYTEVHRTSILSLVASLTPFSDYNQSPRNMYQCQMAKQTMGYPAHNEAAKVESKTYHVHYPQRPIVRTTTLDSHGLEDFPLGTNAVVAVLSYTGYDMEDALILNKSSVERGFGHGCIYKTHRYLAKEIEPDSFFSNTKDGQIVDSDLDAEGLIRVGTRVSKGSKILRVYNTKEQKERVMRYKDGEEGYVDKVIATSDDAGRITGVLLKFRMIRTPTVGDKFSSRHGQKGVFSFPWPDENMPFTQDGLRPDVIINPHAFPSRMTIGMLIESMCGKLSASEDCHVVDATPFQFGEDNRITEEIGKKLAEKGFNYYGNEVMYSGITGEQFKADIFFGLVYYQRLRHMVGDKYQVRATGRLNNLTRQPLKGRKKGGGIRLGEMERDGLLAQGVSFVIRDRFMWCSDGHVAQLCNKCGSFLFTHVKKSDSGTEDVYCSFCKHTGDTTKVYVPYVLRYLAAEFAAMNIRIQFDTK